jgi:hypothetical protein
MMMMMQCPRKAVQQKLTLSFCRGLTVQRVQTSHFDLNKYLGSCPDYGGYNQPRKTMGQHYIFLELIFSK